jgi:hypothetical protein
LEQTELLAAAMLPENVPAGHGVQADAPSWKAYVPAAQFWQVLLLVAPSNDENVPAGQAMHADWLDDA